VRAFGFIDIEKSSGREKESARVKKYLIRFFMPIDEKNRYYKILNQALDPELGIGLADMGLIYGVKKSGSTKKVQMTLTYMGCPLGPQMTGDVEYYLKKEQGVKDVEIEIVWDPPWTLEMMKPEIRQILMGNRENHIPPNFEG
jgi:metal-sulfur cluster biosynthetic enzyme